jgi:ABC-2 type transport system ATP-binding protein
MPRVIPVAQTARRRVTSGRPYATQVTTSPQAGPGGTAPATVPGPPAAPAVLIEGLVKRYRGRAVVDGLSFAAPRGRVTAVLGPNGAGKTTTVECCEGLRRADGGRVRVLGLDPVRDAVRLRPRVGVMLQDGGLPTGARAGDLLRHVAALHARPLPPGDLMELLGLADHARTTVRRLSGGQRQRLALAAAVIGRPEVVFLDEPSAGLDPQARLAVWEVVQRLRGDGVGVVLTTHLMDEAERLADQVIVVDNGRVVAAGSPQELTGATDGTLRFSARPGLDLHGLVAALPAEASAVESGPGSYVVEAWNGLDPGMIATVTSWCAEHGVMPEGLSLRRRTLEDVFLELTGRSLR